MRPKKSEAIAAEPVAPKLTEEEIRAKYQDNEEFNEWTIRAQRLKVELVRGLKKGLPKIYAYDEDFALIAEDFQRVSDIRANINDRI